MAKRLSDSEKWKDEWYLSLSNDNRAIWQYLLDNCSHAGIFKKNLPLLNFCCHTTITDEELKKTFEGRIMDCGAFYLIPKFIKFQYGNNLDSKKPVIKSVRKELEQHGLLETISEWLDNGSLTIKSKSKDMSKDKSKDKSKSRFTPPTLDEVKEYFKYKGYKLKPERFWRFYESKEWMVGKNRMKKWKIAAANAEDTWDKDKESNMGFDRIAKL